jgi:hypothetical protein
VPDRQENGLAALFAIASAAVASEGHTLDVATQVWKTGSFPAIPADATRPRKAPQAATSLDMFGGQKVQPSQQPLSYGHRQQAGVDALIAIATSVVPSDAPREEESGGSSDGPLMSNRNR